MSESLPPAGVPKSGGGGPYIAGVVVLLGLIGGLVWYKSKGTDEPAPPPPPAPVVETTPIVQAPAPPPPPPPPVAEEPTAEPSVKANAGSGVSPCAGTCTGESSAALNTALRSAAGTAQSCYTRALRNTEVSGSMTVSVRVGPNGSVCGASISNDSVNSSEISSCVLGRFRGRSFPAPSGGCVQVNIPISFAIKK